MTTAAQEVPDQRGHPSAGVRADGDLTRPAALHPVTLAALVARPLAVFFVVSGLAFTLASQWEDPSGPSAAGSYGAWLTGLFSVPAEVTEAAAVTLELVVASLAVGAVSGLMLGLALRAGRLERPAARLGLGLTALAAPVTGLTLYHWLLVRFDIGLRTGAVPVLDDWGRGLDRLLVPALVVGFTLTGPVAAMVARPTFTLGPYGGAAMATPLADRAPSSRRWRLGLPAGLLLNGLIVAELLFLRPGLLALIVSAAGRQDRALALDGLALIALTGAGLALAVDLADVLGSRRRAGRHGSGPVIEPGPAPAAETLLREPAPSTETAALPTPADETTLSGPAALTGKTLRPRPEPSDETALSVPAALTGKTLRPRPEPSDETALSGPALVGKTILPGPEPWDEFLLPGPEPSVWTVPPGPPSTGGTLLRRPSPRQLRLAFSLVGLLALAGGAGLAWGRSPRTNPGSRLGRPLLDGILGTDSLGRDLLTLAASGLGQAWVAATLPALVAALVGPVLAELERRLPRLGRLLPGVVVDALWWPLPLMVVLASPVLTGGRLGLLDPRILALVTLGLLPLAVRLANTSPVQTRPGRLAGLAGLWLFLAPVALGANLVAAFAGFDRSTGPSLGQQLAASAATLSESPWPAVVPAVTLTLLLLAWYHLGSHLTTLAWHRSSLSARSPVSTARAGEAEPGPEIRVASGGEHGPGDPMAPPNPITPAGPMVPDVEDAAAVDHTLVAPFAAPEPTGGGNHPPRAEPSPAGGPLAPNYSLQPGLPPPELAETIRLPVVRVKLADRADDDASGD